MTIFYIGQTKSKLAKEWRNVVKGENLLEVAQKTKVLKAKNENMARVICAYADRWNALEVVKDLKL